MLFQILGRGQESFALAPRAPYGPKLWLLLEEVNSSGDDHWALRPPRYRRQSQTGPTLPEGPSPALSSCKFKISGTKEEAVLVAPVPHPPSLWVTGQARPVSGLFLETES